MNNPIYKMEKTYSLDNINNEIRTLYSTNCWIYYCKYLH